MPNGIRDPTFGPARDHQHPRLAAGDRLDVLRVLGAVEGIDRHRCGVVGMGGQFDSAGRTEVRRPARCDVRTAAQTTSATAAYPSTSCAIGGGIEQVPRVPPTSDGLDHADPAVTVRVLVDQLRRVGQRDVHLDHLTGDGGVDVAHGLGRFDLAERCAGRGHYTDAGQVNVDDVPERVLGVVGDPTRIRSPSRRTHSWSLE